MDKKFNINKENTIVISNKEAIPVLENFKIASINNFNNLMIRNIENIIIEFSDINDVLEFLEDNIEIYLYKIFLIDTLKPLSLKRYKTRYEILYNKLMSKLDKKNDILIFGTEQAGSIAYKLSQYFKLNVKYFIDDYKTGFFEDSNIEIITKEILKSKKLNNIGLVIVGPAQKGIEKGTLENIAIFKIQDIFVGKL